MNVDDEIRQLGNEARNGIESFAKADRSFNCALCGEYCVPADGQWIFYNLCNDCFTVFDSQKMNGRSTAMLCRMEVAGYTPKPYHESSAAWIAEVKARGEAGIASVRRQAEEIRERIVAALREWSSDRGNKT